MFACQKYLKDEDLVTPLGLITRLVLGNNIFVDQFCSAVRDLKVSLWGIDILLWEATLSKLICIHSEKGTTLKGKNLLPMGAHSILVAETSFQKGIFV